MLVLPPTAHSSVDSPCASCLLSLSLLLFSPIVSVSHSLDTSFVLCAFLILFCVWMMTAFLTRATTSIRASQRFDSAKPEGTSLQRRSSPRQTSFQHHHALFNCSRTCCAQVRSAKPPLVSASLQRTHSLQGMQRLGTDSIPSYIMYSTNAGREAWIQVHRGHSRRLCHDLFRVVQIQVVCPCHTTRALRERSPRH